MNDIGINHRSYNSNYRSLCKSILKYHIPSRHNKCRRRAEITFGRADLAQEELHVWQRGAISSPMLNTLRAVVDIVDSYNTILYEIEDMEYSIKATLAQGAPVRVVDQYIKAIRKATDANY